MRFQPDSTVRNRFIFNQTLFKYTNRWFVYSRCKIAPVYNSSPESVNANVKLPETINQPCLHRRKWYTPHAMAMKHGRRKTPSQSRVKRIRSLSKQGENKYPPVIYNDIESSKSRH
jgi:hypothetical protein